ncbi:MAG: phosphoglycerate dehydrogenase [Candidatus Azotimanducaceae bacterium]|uniref:D-3-phosphoglycerate dehydrogenase n=1 Tax=OM182 bacterium TaxID=2510334 RepID=A0A520S195_9GAMM|nr:3-phosphoglycerate dehydrogenase [Gammaproteobacteria bacterium]OUV68799.1 MAG: 3-phosphoglycerate dehydrogenase [Gammaproteobacteria bacterium TMED133]RZO76236.1 MAG: 3-phosphoglycerate dehydrogenase [OM182 bacterium]
MHKIRTINNISSKGLERFPNHDFKVGSDITDPDAILVRSQILTVDDVTPKLRAVGRAGAGVNNIPVSAYTEKGIVVFNTPGANANAVKELVMAALLISARDIVGGIDYVRNLSGISDKVELNKLIEANKKNYGGQELKGKTLGVLGLGAIGSMVAEMALQMDMNVLGYDPALSVDAAWRISRRVQKMENMQSLFSKSDIVTLHVPVLDSTRGMINGDSLAQFKHGAVIINFAREEIVDQQAISVSLDSGKIRQYISDFPTPDLIEKSGVIATPHLGASTREAEENCAVMVCEQILDFLRNGNINNSVNFPNLSLERGDGYRIAIVNQNVPRILGSVLSILADRNINVIDMLNKSLDDVAYNLIDIETKPTTGLLADIENIQGIINVRVFDE